IYLTLRRNQFSMLMWLMDFRERASSLTLLVLCALVATCPAVAQSSEDVEVDREYVLKAWITGYVGVGGDVEGVRNPVLKAVEGEVVRITIVNADPLVHDLKMEALGVKTPEVLEVGDQASVTFTAEASDTYFCTTPVHRAAGIECLFAVF